MTMMLFNFICPGGHVFDDLVESAVRTSKCPRCGKTGRRTIAHTPISARVKHPGVQDSDPRWLAGMANLIQDPDKVRIEGEAPIESRGDFNRFIKNKGLHLVGNREI